MAGAPPLKWKRHVVTEGYANRTAVAADFTGDGLPDVITNFNVGRRQAQTVLYVAPDWRPVVIDAEPTRQCIHSEVMDVNRDGRPDFIGTRYQPGLIFWLECPRDVTAGPWTYRLIDDQVNGIHGLMVGEIDGDGHPDLVANSAQPKGPFPNSLAWYRVPRNPGTAKQWERHILARGDAPGLSHYLGIGDVDGDGRADVATGAKGGPQAVPGTGDWFAWWKAPADRTGVWTKRLLAAGQLGATNILMADVNRDGKTDFVAARGHGQGLLWFAAPDWTPHEINSSLTGPHCLAIGDIDDDGDTDAVTCAKDDRIAAWFENDGRGRFTTHVIGTDQAAYDIRLVDMDRDGDLDVLIAGQASNNVVWYENMSVTAKR